MDLQTGVLIIGGLISFLTGLVMTARTKRKNRLGKRFLVYHGLFIVGAVCLSAGIVRLFSE